MLEIETSNHGIMEGKGAYKRHSNVQEAVCVWRARVGNGVSRRGFLERAFQGVVLMQEIAMNKDHIAKTVDFPIVEQIASESERIEGDVVRTKYRHITEIDPGTGTYYCDCSGYVSYVLQQVAPKHLRLIPKEANWDRPRAFKYYEFFASLSSSSTNGWIQIHDLANSVPGDIIAWEETTADPPPANEDTGHVLIVVARPQLIEPFVLSVAVDDSSDVLHYDDSRDRNGERKTGVGTGRLRFQIDGLGQPTAVQFNAQEIFRDHPIAIGRCEKFA